MARRHVERQHAFGREAALVEVERLGGQQMDRDRVTREGVERAHQHERDERRGSAGRLRRLGEEHARGPVRRRSAEPRQDRPTDDRLDLEEEERAQEYGRGAKHQPACSTGRASVVVGRALRAASGGRVAG